MTINIDEVKTKINEEKKEKDFNTAMLILKSKQRNIDEATIALERAQKAYDEFIADPEKGIKEYNSNYTLSVNTTGGLYISN